jgi:hypothetical protein
MAGPPPRPSLRFTIKFFLKKMKKRNVLHYVRSLIVCGCLLAMTPFMPCMQAQSPLPQANLITTEGNTRYYSLVLGSQQEPEEDLELLHFSVELVPDGESTPEFYVDITEGWLNQDLYADHDVNPLEEGFEFYWNSSFSGGISGYGEIATVIVVDGGIGVIDNIDAKAHHNPQPSAPQFTIFHNFRTQVLQVASNLPFDGTAELWDSRGNLHIHTTIMDASHFQLGTGMLEPGIYILVLQNETSCFRQKVLILR